MAMYFMVYFCEYPFTATVDKGDNEQHVPLSLLHIHLIHYAPV